MSSINFLKPDRTNLNTFLYLGSFLFFISILDVFLNSFFRLNLTKNSSLAAAIAYPDLVLVFAGTALMQTGKAIEIVGITMLTYLSISLAIAALMNWYNKKIEIKEK